jgi:FtsZ-interacting cell division protein ZipA
MSTGLIIAIVVAAIILIALFAFVLPRMRRQKEMRDRRRELEHRRERVAGEHRDEAEGRSRNAELAEQKARIAEQEAKRERAEAELHQSRAEAHERGMADEELVEDHERDRFASASPSMRDDDDSTMRRDEPAPIEGDSDYERGREDERRFSRDDATADDPPRRTTT